MLFRSARPGSAPPVALHSTDAREAGAIGGWPETRRAPAPLRPSPFIPLTPARPAPSVGGLRQGAPRLRTSPAVTSAYSAGGRGAGTGVGDLSAARAWSSSTPSVVPG